MNFFNTIGNPQKIVAPMVDHSGLAYRMLCRKYGADLVYTQMFHARMFVESEEYRKNNFQTCLNDRPLIVQFCGNDPQILLQAAKLVEDSCDAVDINLGCPQGIAKRGRYGAFLMEELDLLSNIVRTMSQGLKIPVTCKTRIYKDFDRTIRLCETLSNAGASLLTIHGRTREEKKQLIAEADWNTLRRIKLHYADKGIPIISNGGIGTIGDFYSCLEFTGVDGVMVSEAILEDPAFFSRPIPPNSYTNEMKYPLIDTPSNYVPHPVVTLESPTQYELAMEYLHFCHLYPPSQHRTIRSHLMKFLYRYFSKHPEFRNRLGDANTLADYEIICQELGVVLSQHDDREYTDIWYTRHQREKIEEETKSPTKTDKLKFESFFERLMNENNNKEENGCDGECDDGLFSGTGMFNTLVEDVNITESDSKI